MAFGGVFSSEQDQRVGAGIFESDAKHSDTALGGVVAVRLSESEGVTARLVGTAGIARRKTTRTGAIHSESSPEILHPSEQQLIDYVPALGGGLDFSIRVSSRVSIVPMFRVYHLADDDRYPAGNRKRGVSSWLWLGGLGAQLSF